MMTKYFILALAVIQLSFAQPKAAAPKDAPPTGAHCNTDQDCQQGKYVFSCQNKDGTADQSQKKCTAVSAAPELSECIVIVCEGDNFYLSCPAGKTLSISSAIYGRSAGGTVCPYSNPNPVFVSNTSCSSSTSTSTVKNACDGMPICKIDVNNGAFGGDPCPGTYKYMEVTYTCQ